MAIIKIVRTNEYNNRFRNYGVYVDRKKIGTIANGETKDFNIANGKHELICKIDWCSSPLITFDINDDDIKIFKVGGFKNGNWLLPIALGLTVIIYFLNFLGKNSNYFLLLLIPFFLLVLYYATIGRRKYLTLHES